MPADTQVGRCRALQVVLAEVAHPEPMPLSERIARALLPVVLRHRLEGLATSGGTGSGFETASRTILFPPHP
jgi:hypothetical protein